MTKEEVIILKKLQREKNILKADIENLKNELILMVTNIVKNKEFVNVDCIVEEIETILTVYKE